MKNAWILVAASLFVVAPFALADTIQLDVHSSVTASISSPNDSYYGTYSNVPGRTLPVDDPTVRGGVAVPFSNVSVLLPSGSVFEGATINIIVPGVGDPAIGTGYEVAKTPFGTGINHSLPSVAPTFSKNGTSNVFVEQVSSIGGTSFAGDLVSTNIQSLDFLLYGRVHSSVLDPGFNWAGYLGGDAHVVIPYTVELDVTYSVVPEPSTLALFGAGLLGLSAVVRRRTRSS